MPPHQCSRHARAAALRRGCLVPTFRPVSKPLPVPGARATLLLSLTMSFVGVSGVVQAYAVVTATSEQLAPLTAEEEVAPWNRFAVATLTDPVMRGVQVGNLLASALLIIAAVLLTSRRHTALWWTRQALIANALYTLADAAATIHFATLHPELIEQILPQEGLDDPPMLLIFGVTKSFIAALVLAFYALLYRASRRADIKAFLQPAPQQGGGA